MNHARVSGATTEDMRECYSKGLRLIVRFSTYPTLRQSNKSRIVIRHHDNTTTDATETFVDRYIMHEAGPQSVTKVWDECSIHPSIKMPDVGVETYQDPEHQPQRRRGHLGVYKN